MSNRQNQENRNMGNERELEFENIEMTDEKFLQLRHSAMEKIREHMLKHGIRLPDNDDDLANLIRSLPQDGKD